MLLFTYKSWRRRQRSTSSSVIRPGIIPVRCVQRYECLESAAVSRRQSACMWDCLLKWTNAALDAVHGRCRRAGLDDGQCVLCACLLARSLQWLRYWGLPAAVGDYDWRFGGQHLTLIKLLTLSCYLANHPSGVGKWSTNLLAGVKTERVHLCRAAGNTAWSHMAGDVAQLWVGISPWTSYTQL